MPIRRSLKKRRIDDGADTIAANGGASLASMSRSVSPPARASPATVPGTGDPVESTDDSTGKEVDRAETTKGNVTGDRNTATRDVKRPQSLAARNAALAAIARFEGKQPQFEAEEKPKSRKLIPSPFQLTSIRDLAPDHNVNTVTLDDILGHPLLAECWQFNYLHSIPFIISHFDDDVRKHVSLKVVHGFWKRDDSRKQMLEAQAAAVGDQVGDVKLIAAHMPEMYGTHHSKMMILIRRDGVAQVVIHTANMIEQDWRNLTQAVWRSPELPLLPEDHAHDADESEAHAIGSGLRFKADLLNYLRAYEGRTKTLVAELRKYDFSAIRAALIASTPGKISPETHPEHETTAFGWPGLKQILNQVPIVPPADDTAPVLNVQISSVATLTENWVNNFLSILNTRQKGTGSPLRKKPKYNIIFPTAREIRKSLDGYSSGDSIHMKLQSPAQQKQLSLLKPMLHHWRGNLEDAKSSAVRAGTNEAFRNAAAPHIKTYIRFSDSTQNTIDWAMITSANLSQQAWGFTTDKNNQVRIASYEIGVAFWPELFADSENQKGKLKMVPVFGKNLPDVEDTGEDAETVVGVRMPYDLPLVPYAKDDVPWCATARHSEPDWMGNVWGGYEDRM